MDEEPPKADHGDGSLTVQQAADIVANQLDADVIHYNSPVVRPADALLIDACNNRRRRRNVLFSLVTAGGDADAAYRIARCLQKKYERFYFHVTGYCKSAGTLVALGAHELVMSDHGELGPLDVQMSIKDELLQTQSGLAVTDALLALREYAFNAFESQLLDIISKSGGALSSMSAAKIATDLTVGLFAPLCNQVDPVHISEASRAMLIAGLYGKSLLESGSNIDLEQLNSLLTAYPSHGFVIDRLEAESLFKAIREPTVEEAKLASLLGSLARWPIDAEMAQNTVPFAFLSSEQDKIAGSHNGKHTNGGENEENGNPDRA